MNTYYGLPADVKFCKNCVISNQRPSSTVEFKSKSSDLKSVIDFDSDGVCSACRFHTEKEHGIDWEKRETQLLSLLDKHRRSDGSYDVIVPGSGGKDSAFASHILKYKYGMNPLTVTWAPHLYTNIGFENFQNWMHVGGLDNILYTPNGDLHRAMTKNAFHNLLHPFQPFIIGQRLIGPSFAQKFGVSLVFYGENQAEYGNAIAENKNALMSMDYFSVENFKASLFGGLPLDKYLNEDKFSLGDFSPYIPPSKDSLIASNVEVHYLGYYLKWDPQECFYYAVENTGFKPNYERTEGSYSKYSSIDDKIDPFHYFTTLIKFGIGRATYDASQEVRNEKITREEAMYLVEKYDTEFPSKYFSEFLDYIDTTESKFWETVEKFRSPHLWKKVNSDWKLRHTVNLSGVDD
ncbi:N-acetyl sugar amidotransferase [Synechococcus sp. AH-551-N23]|nr:N-acetyl sugar amidotransferase [Synechococcus sp. AH-551-N23]